MQIDYKYRAVIHNGIFLLCLLAFSGCARESTPESQVAVTVNGDEITVHQINYDLAQYAGAGEVDLKRDTGQVINSLVDRQLLVQRAIEAKLDREPRVLRALEKARSMVLAQAYLEPLVSSIPEPSDKEVAEFFEKHPELFMKRRVYQYEEVRAGPKIAYEEIAKRAGKADSFKDIINWLQAAGAHLTFRVAVEPAEKLPLEILPTLARLDSGETAVFKISQGSWILHIVGIKDSPMPLDVGAPYIRRYLVNERKKNMVSTELKRLREAARISYLGNFASYGEASGSLAPDDMIVGNSLDGYRTDTTGLSIDVY